MNETYGKKIECSITGDGTNSHMEALNAMSEQRWVVEENISMSHLGMVIGFSPMEFTFPGIKPAATVQ